MFTYISIDVKVANSSSESHANHLQIPTITISDSEILDSLSLLKLKLELVDPEQDLSIQLHGGRAKELTLLPGLPPEVRLMTWWKTFQKAEKLMLHYHSTDWILAENLHTICYFGS